MKNSPLLPNEQERLEELLRSAWLDTTPEKAFDHIPQPAARILAAPMAVTPTISRGMSDQWHSREFPRGLSDPPGTIRVIGDVPWGTHFCCFYETKQDLLDTLVRVGGEFRPPPGHGNPRVASAGGSPPENTA